MADVIDRASEQEEYLRQAALQKRGNAYAKPSAEFCEDCGQYIPEVRRACLSGCMTCVDCQELRELRHD